MTESYSMSLSLVAEWDDEGRLTLWAPSRLPGVWMPVEFLAGPYAHLVGAYEDLR